MQRRSLSVAVHINKNHGGHVHLVQSPSAIISNVTPFLRSHFSSPTTATVNLFRRRHDNQPSNKSNVFVISNDRRLSGAVASFHTSFTQQQQQAQPPRELFGSRIDVQKEQQQQQPKATATTTQAFTQQPPQQPQSFKNVASSSATTSNNKSTQSSLLSSLSSSSSRTIMGIPRQALLLGPAGLIPVLAPHLTPDFLMNEYMEAIVNAQLSYATVLLPFLGAIHWGFAFSNYYRGGSSSGSNNHHHHHQRTQMQDWLQYVMAGVLPFLISWAALTADDQSTAVWLLIGGFTLVLSLDFVMWAIRLTPLWYPVLRLPLTLGVVTCLYFTYLNFVKEKVIIPANVASFLISGGNDDDNDGEGTRQKPKQQKRVEEEEEETLILPLVEVTDEDEGGDGATTTKTAATTGVDAASKKPVIKVAVKKPSQQPKTTLFVHGEIPKDDDEDDEEILRRGRK